MKILMLHGDDVEKSGARLQKFIDAAKKRNWQVVRVNAERDNLKTSINSHSLFDETRIFLIENPVKLTKSDLEWLGKNEKEIDETIVFYHTSELSKTFISALPKIDKIETFEIPKKIWQFLDSFTPGKASSCITLLHDVAESDSIEFAFAMLARHLKDMYQVLVDEVSFSVPDWRKQKLKSQASKIGEARLEKIISEMAKIDVKSKTSKGDLTGMLDILIATQLE